MSAFVLHPDALADLNQIWEFIATDNPDAADRVLDDIRDAIGTLVSFPELGHVRADLTSRPLRFHAVRDFLIVSHRMKNHCRRWRYSMAGAIPA
jgi:plasmid stabilization system protein ParE